MGIKKSIKLRELITKKGTLVLAGKDASTNEALIKQVKPNEEVFHTIAAGSPFVNIKGKPKFGDVKEAAIFCAVYSRDWKQNKTDIVVHRFKGKDIYKTKDMKLGTFGVKRLKKIKIKKQVIERFEK